MRRNSEKGNAFIFILLGVALFAALAFTVSRSMHSDTTTTMSARDVELAVTDILSYGQQLERAVSLLRRRGISESDISFHTAAWGHTDYEHTPAQPDSNGIFSLSGGGVNYRLPKGMTNMSFLGDFMIKGLGDDTLSELSMLSTGINFSICEAINKKMGVTGIPVETAMNTSTGPFTGSYTPRAVKNTIGDNPVTLAGKRAGCWENGAASGSYIFYFVLLER